MHGEVLRGIMDGFWNEHVWLPPNTTWKDIAPGSSDTIRYSNPKHLYIPIPLAFLMLALRYYLEHKWFAPLGVAIGMKEYRSKTAPPNAVLERAYMRYKRVNNKQIQGLAKQLDWPDRKVERWLRLRRSQDQPSTLMKFCENSWRCLYYVSSFLLGLVVLWNKPWFWDISQCWFNYPHQSIDIGIWCQYIISLAFYWSLCLSQFFDRKRKDFWQMFGHHVATIALMSLSWMTNMHRIGSLVLIVHDSADIFLDAAKMAKYSGYQKTCDAIFAMFTLVWFATRLGAFPFWILRNTLIENPPTMPMFPVYHILNGLLMSLLALHIFWTYLILKIAYNSLYAGGIEGDIRSSSSNCSDDSISD
ncbi:hypothetical protein PPYR_03108 [Photinus pyralis]|uniref:TLC domain-containing protein n=1 Tax=Photinus pyralis TaxID=7054 RepID=A0A5N4A217_PHOPY|nr:ceramide synthase 6-like [Photinus pyralis]KAB0791308.1 hypothetical protein PPYR_03108 [Photinus pyralis]